METLSETTYSKTKFTGNRYSSTLNLFRGSDSLLCIYIIILWFPSSYFTLDSFLYFSAWLSYSESQVAESASRLLGVHQAWPLQGTSHLYDVRGNWKIQIKSSFSALGKRYKHCTDSGPDQDWCFGLVSGIKKWHHTKRCAGEAALV